MTALAVLSLLFIPKHYVCGYTSTPIKIDGRLETQWARAPLTDDFVDISTQIRPRFRTRAKMLWDSKYFYIAAVLQEPHVWGTLTQHDAVIFQDNDFEVFIDPDGDNHQYYELEINALNTTWDLRLVKPYRDGGPALNEWEIPGLKSAVYVRGTLNDARDTDDSWTVELAIPWKPLAEFANRNCPPRDGDQWRLNFSRVEWKIKTENGRYEKLPNTPEANWVWSPQSVIDMHRPERWGFVQFSSRPPGSAVKFRPDKTLEARDVLHQLYYAQKTYYEKNKKWARTLGELGIYRPGLVMVQTKDGWMATYKGVAIRSDSKVSVRR